ncbi:hypothetical protein [Vibrio olivae]|uniref:Uncharacterized protein n=1 Tax=Vibrio olivae TaxID=1243002 RepID=A0ABV5HIK7_9VIBR
MYDERFSGHWFIDVCVIYDCSSPNTFKEYDIVNFAVLILGSGIILFSLIAIIYTFRNKRKTEMIHHLARYALRDVRNINAYKKQWAIAKALSQKHGHDDDVFLQEERLEGAFNTLEDELYQLDMLVNNHRFSWTALALNLRNCWMDIKLNTDKQQSVANLTALNDEFEVQYVALIDALEMLEGDDY